jgi:hypothetical protein
VQKQYQWDKALEDGMLEILDQSDSADKGDELDEVVQRQKL